MMDGPDGDKREPWEPWIAFREAAPGLTIASPSNTEPIARVSGYLQPVVANARLIAAAPDLLATLEAISTAWGNLERKPVPTKHPAYGTGETYLSPAGRMIAAELIEQARAAIAKAEGK
jgi:hypothetical protein